MDLMKPYDDALQEILETGVSRTNKRTGIKTLSVFGMMKRYRLDTEYFPILTRRKTWPKSVFSELLWFLSGSTNNKDLKDLGCNFWTPWVDDEFEKRHGFSEECFGPVYGFQLRHFGGVYGNGIGGFNKLNKNAIDPYYASYSLIGEETAVDAGTTSGTTAQLSRKPIKGTIVANVFVGNHVLYVLKDVGNGTFELSSRRDENLLSAFVDYSTGQIALNWDELPGEHHLRADYEYDYVENEQNLYGKGGFDQLAWVVNRIKEDPSCRRTLWTLWNPQDVSTMRLPPCHMMYQVLVDDDRNLTGIMYQRSCDFPIGVPANIQFYSALTAMIAQQTDCVAKEFVHVTADSHIYGDQIEAVKRYLDLPKTESPRLKINKAADIFSYEPEDFVISDCHQGPKIDIPVAV